MSDRPRTEEVRRDAKLEKRAETLLHLKSANQWRRPPLEIELLQFLDQAAADAILTKQEVQGE